MLALKAFTFSPVQENTYVLYNDNKQCCIIDPGCYFAEEKAMLKDFIENEGLKPVLLLNTHCHLDHVFGNKFVHETWNLTLHIHEKEKRVLEAAPISGKTWQLNFDNYEGELIFIREESRIKIGNEELEVRFTPGHSPGSVSFYHEPGGFVIGGDVLFNGSIGRTDLPGGDYETLLKAIAGVLFSFPDDSIVLSGHGPETTIGRERTTNPFVLEYLATR